MTAKRSDIATAEETFWDFLEIPEIEVGLRSKARAWARKFDGVDADDLFQEAVLYLAVRPELVASDYEQGGAGWVIQSGSLAMGNYARQEVLHQHEPYDPDEVEMQGNG